MVGSISGLGTTFNLPNFLGLLYNITPTDTKLLSAIGGLTGGGNFTAGMGDSALFAWQEEDLRSADNRPHLEGADAPEGSARVRSSVYNVLQIIHESVSISYTKLAAVGQLADVGSNHPNVAQVTGTQPVQNEMQRQISLRMREIARDVEFVFLNGTFQEPSDNTTERQTRGLLEATTTNVEEVADITAFTKEDLFNLMQSIWENGGIMDESTATVIVNATLRRRLTELFIDDNTFRQSSRTVGGVSVDTIITDFGELNVMLNRHIGQENSADVLQIASLEWLAPVHLLVPGKGFLFVEPLGKEGSRDESQIYGEIGLYYGNERAHGKLRQAAA